MGFIAIHLGVGVYSDKNNYKEYENLIIKATNHANQILKRGGSAMDACTEAIKLLEDDPLVNCGVGSNLTKRGTVECDASIMDGRTQHFGACGAVNTVKNPIELAHRICIDQLEDTITVPPCILVGEGAKTYAELAGLTMINNKSLITRRAYKIYRKYKKHVTDYNNFKSKFELERNQKRENVQCHRKTKYCKLDTKGDKSDESSSEDGEPNVEVMNDMFKERMDTVGAVCIDNTGGLAAGVSSGGIILKPCGRLGQACIMGAGVWADQSVAVSTTGCGEYIIKTHLAKEIAGDAIQKDFSITETLRNKYSEAPILKNAMSDKIVGAIVLSINEGVAQFSFAHTDKHMGVGYMNTNDTEPYTVISTEAKKLHRIQVNF